MGKSRMIISVLVVGYCWLSGCAKDPFSLRDTEPPDGEGGTYETPVDPLTAVRNLRFAMNERNVVNYERCYADSFVYVFDFLLVVRPGLGRSWAAADETRLVRNMFAALDGIAVAWSVTPGQTDWNDDTTAVLYRTYAVTASETVADTAVTETFTGELILHLERNDLDLWWIIRWEDSHVSDQAPAWSDLKSRYL